MGLLAGFSRRPSAASSGSNESPHGSPMLNVILDSPSPAGSQSSPTFHNSVLDAESSRPGTLIDNSNARDKTGRKGSKGFFGIRGSEISSVGRKSRGNGHWDKSSDKHDDPPPPAYSIPPVSSLHNSQASSVEENLVRLLPPDEADDRPSDEIPWVGVSTTSTTVTTTTTTSIFPVFRKKISSLPPIGDSPSSISIPPSSSSLASQVDPLRPSSQITSSDVPSDFSYHVPPQRSLPPTPSGDRPLPPTPMRIPDGLRSQSNHLAAYTSGASIVVTPSSPNLRRDGGPELEGQDVYVQSNPGQVTEGGSISPDVLMVVTPPAEHSPKLKKKISHVGLGLGFPANDHSLPPSVPVSPSSSAPSTPPIPIIFKMSPSPTKSTELPQVSSVDSPLPSTASSPAAPTLVYSDVSAPKEVTIPSPAVLHPTSLSILPSSSSDNSHRHSRHRALSKAKSHSAFSKKRSAMAAPVSLHDELGEGRSSTSDTEGSLASPSQSSGLPPAEVRKLRRRSSDVTPRISNVNRNMIPGSQFAFLDYAHQPSKPTRTASATSEPATSVFSGDSSAPSSTQSTPLSRRVTLWSKRRTVTAPSITTIPNRSKGDVGAESSTTLPLENFVLPHFDLGRSFMLDQERVFATPDQEKEEVLRDESAQQTLPSSATTNGLFLGLENVMKPVTPKNLPFQPSLVIPGSNASLEANEPVSPGSSNLFRRLSNASSSTSDQKSGKSPVLSSTSPLKRLWGPQRSHSSSSLFNTLKESESVSRPRSTGRPRSSTMQSTTSLSSFPDTTRGSSSMDRHRGTSSSSLAPESASERLSESTPRRNSLLSTANQSPSQTRPRSATSSGIENRDSRFFSSSPKKSSRPAALRKFSSGVFGSPTNNSSLFPLPPRQSSSGSLSPGLSSPRRGSFVDSPRGSADVKKKSSDVPVKTDEESSEDWLRRLLEVVPRSEVANVLASSTDEFYKSALKSYMSSFDFHDTPLDIALRRLLMEISLPRETQQIDRVMEVFAAQYQEGNPGLFLGADDPYVLAFSLIMLHTDAFNKSNKNKMSKVDYMRNTRMEGVLPEVLDCFFDNITFTPFVYIEEDTDIMGLRTNLPESHSSSSSAFVNSSSSTTTAKNKLDVYHLIAQNQLHTLRAQVATLIPRSSPFSSHGTKATFDINALHLTFAEAALFEIGASSTSGTRSRAASDAGPTSRRSSTMFGNSLPQSSPSAPATEELTVKLAKIGVILRKDDLVEGGRKASSRKWKEWTVVLTGSQLLFFKDPILAASLQVAVSQSASNRRPSGGRTLPRLTNFKPDEVLSVKDAVALVDASYSKYPNAFRFVMPHQRSYILQASSEEELNEWVSLINYAAAFKTASIRIRGLGMTSSQAALAGAAAAASHARAVKSEKAGIPPSSPLWIKNDTDGTFNPFSTAFSATMNRDASQTSTPSASPSKAILFTPRVRSASRPPPIDLESPEHNAHEGGQQLESAYMEIKAELAAGRGGATKLSVSQQEELRSARSSVDRTITSERSSFEVSTVSDSSGSKLKLHSSDSSVHASRTEALKLKITTLQAKITTTQAHLSEELRVARNLAVLTPFLRSTRDRIFLAALPLSKKVEHLRIDLCRLRVFEEILEADLLGSEEMFRKVLSSGFQAAQVTLRQSSEQYGEESVGPMETMASLPHLAVHHPVHDDEHILAPSPTPITLTAQPSHLNAAEAPVPSHPSAAPSTWQSNRRQSRAVSLLSHRSSHASFHSALEDPEDWNQGQDLSSGIQLESGAHDPPTPRFLGSVGRRGSSTPSVVAVGHPHTIPNEDEPVAEDWAETKASRRVSLAKVPSVRLNRESLDSVQIRSGGPDDETTVGENAGNSR